MKTDSSELDLRKLHQVSFTDLVRNQKGDLLFVQLPDVLPGQVDERFLTNPIIGNIAYL